MNDRQQMAFQKLNLTENQKAQLKTQRESMRKQMDELKKNDNITVKEWKAKREAIQKENKDKMTSILTNEQKAQLEKMKTDNDQKRQGMMMKRNDRMKERLNLTSEQSAKMEKSRADVMAKSKAIRENKSLTDEQKRTQLKELHTQQQENMKSILTEEQLKKLKESKRQRPGDPTSKPSFNQQS
jgi:Spy/CpxP family protein refolding chaperone